MRRLSTFIAISGLTACGPTQTIPACTLAVGKRPAVGTEGPPGGFVEIQVRESLGAAQTRPAYCAASITFDGSTPRVWTAQHCYRAGLMETITFHADIGNRYVPIPLSTPDLAAAKAIRAAYTPRDPDLVADFLAVLNGASKISKDTSTLTKRCLEKSVTHRSTCFTALDLVAIPASLTSDASPDAVTAIASLKNRFSRLGALDLALLRAYGAAQDELSTERKAWAAHAFLERYKTCVTERKANAYCSDTYMAESLSVYENFLDVSAFSANRNRLAVNKTKVASPFEMKAKWQLLALKNGRSAREKLAGVWDKIDGRNDLYISANLTETPDATRALYGASPVLAKRALPDSAAPHETIAALRETIRQNERTSYGVRVLGRVLSNFPRGTADHFSLSALSLSPSCRTLMETKPREALPSSPSLVASLRVHQVSLPVARIDEETRKE